MFSLYRLFALILSTLVIFSMFNQGMSVPIDSLQPNHAGPKQIGSEHLGPSKDHHAGPPRGHSHGGSVPREDIVLY